MTNITLNNETKTMSSVEIAELTGKEHFHVMADIRNMLEELGESENPKFDSQYQGSRRMEKCYKLDKELTLTLITGYSIKLRHAIIKRWEEMEKALTFISEEATSLEEAQQIAISALTLRDILRKNHLNVTDVIQRNKETIGGGKWCYSNILRLASIASLGDVPSVVKKYEDNPRGLQPRDYMVEKNMIAEIQKYDNTVCKIELLADMGFGYSEIKQKLNIES